VPADTARLHGVGPAHARARPCGLRGECVAPHSRHPARFRVERRSPRAPRRPRGGTGDVDRPGGRGGARAARRDHLRVARPRPRRSAAKGGRGAGGRDRAPGAPGPASRTSGGAGGDSLTAGRRADAPTRSRDHSRVRARRQSCPDSLGSRNPPAREPGVSVMTPPDAGIAKSRTVSNIRLESHGPRSIPRSGRWLRGQLVCLVATDRFSRASDIGARVASPPTTGNNE
jgi:hypothetical protein